MSIRQRFNAWIQGKVDAYAQDKIREAVKFYLPSNSDLMAEFIQRMDIQPLAELVATNDDLTRAVVSELEDGIDTDDIAEKVARGLDASDVASYMDASDVASNLDIDSSEIAERVLEDLDMSSLAEELDYDKLAEALVGKLKEAWTH